ncbi:MAG: 30S ribosomal protein S6 [Patescibacteria group bacterium]|nr:30S ribosomal protein S6 [Patescibacteria group bacterium]
MAENVYEGMFILDSNQYGRDQGGISGLVAKMLEDAGGAVMVSRLWEERRLAFPIKGHRKGTYWLTYFRLNSTRLADIQRQCELSDAIIRSLFLKVDPRIVDALVEHAMAARPSSSDASPEAAVVAAVNTAEVVDETVGVAANDLDSE